MSETKTAAAENPQAKEANKGEAVDKAKATVKEGADATKGKVADVMGKSPKAPSGEHPGQSEKATNWDHKTIDYHHPEWLTIRRPKMPSMDGAKGLAKLGGLALPHVGITALAYSYARKVPPFSWVDRGARAAGRWAVDNGKKGLGFIKDVGGVVAWPAITAAKIVATPPYFVLHRIWDFFGDIQRKHAREAGEGHVEGGAKHETSLPLIAAKSIGGGAWNLGKSLGSAYLTLWKKPLVAVAAHAIVLGGGLVPFMSAINTAAPKVIDAFVKIAEAIPRMFPGP